MNDIQSRQEILKNLKLFSKMKHKLLNKKYKLKVKDREELTRDDILGKSNKLISVARYQPLYNPCGPSFLITLRKQSKLFAYSLS